MTETSPPPRKHGADRWPERGVLLLILLGAAALRIRGIGFGLPALYDPDEPLFMMTALDMVRSHSANPGWFGHPGTITLYCLSLISLAVAGTGLAIGRYPDAAGFVSAVYADPTILFLPARLFFALCGTACVFLTWRLGRRIGGSCVALVAAAALGVNGLHVDYSQLIRTDIQASIFMLLEAGATLSIVQRGRQRDYLLAGLFLGLGCATKWPAATMALGPLTAGAWRLAHGHRDARKLAMFAAAAGAALLLASPYLLLDHASLVRDLSAEARPMHPGATGGGALANLSWYIGNPLRDSFGIAGLVVAALGAARIARRDRKTAIAVFPVFAASLLLISVQALRWERWVIPLLPFLAIAIGCGVACLARTARRWTARRLPLLELLLAALVLLPMLHAAETRAGMRANDTRALASAWLRRHARPGSSVLVEHAALDLLSGSWTLLFPLGTAGCVDARAALSNRIRYSDAERLRAGRPIVDLGAVDPRRLPSCRARYLVLSHLDRYADERHSYAAEWQRYALLTDGAVLRCVIAPEPGRRGGPKIFIFETRIAQRKGPTGKPTSTSRVADSGHAACNLDGRLLSGRPVRRVPTPSI